MGLRGLWVGEADDDAGRRGPASARAVGGRRGRRRAGRRGPAWGPAQPGAAGCPKGSWPSNTAGAPYRVRLHRSRRTRSRTPSAPRHPGLRWRTVRSA